METWAPFEVPAPGTRSQSYLITSPVLAGSASQVFLPSGLECECSSPGCQCEQATNAGLVMHGQ